MKAGGTEGGIEALVARFGAYFFDDRRHRASLPMMATWLTTTGRHREALAMLDRYWRTGPDGVQDRVLQAAILREIAGPEAGLAALRRATAIDPSHPMAVRSLVASLQGMGQDGEARQVATAALARCDDPDLMAFLLPVADPLWRAYGAARRIGDTLQGWCAWRGDAGPHIIAGEADGRRFALEIDEAMHRSRSGLAFGRFETPWPASARKVVLRHAATGAALRGMPLIDDVALDESLPDPPTGIAVTVIIPVYGDEAATRACFDSLLADGCVLPRRLLVVDDASPDPDIRGLLESLAGDGRIACIRNPENLGFIRSVNRALRRVGREDVVLLNADTVVPPGWLERLAQVAAEPGVGTVTPLSNNGELVSVPAPFVANPLPSAEVIAALDAAAQRLSAPAIDLPNGNGFCLYIRNAALAAAGHLDAESYERGYLEEVDFCLRVAAAGFRNVCAPGVYVGHRGEVSFGGEKSGLVAANAAQLVRRWPDIELQTKAFMTADPLKAVRGALAWARFDAATPCRLIVSAGRVPDGLVQRLREDAPGSEVLVLLTPTVEPATWRLTVPPRDSAGQRGTGYSVPLEADMTGLGAREALSAVLARLQAPSLVGVLDGDIDRDIIAALRHVNMPIDVLLATDDPVRLAWLEAEAGRSGRILVTTRAMARRAMSLAGGSHRDHIVLLNEGPCPAPAELVAANGPSSRLAASTRHLGVLMPDASPSSHAVVRQLAQALLRRGSPTTLVLLGESYRDVGLLRLGNVFVTGRLPACDAAIVAALHGLSGLLLPARMPVWAGEDIEPLRALDLPWAAFPVGEAGDRLTQDSRGIRLDPDWSDDRLALAIDMDLFPRRAEGEVA